MGHPTASAASRVSPFRKDLRDQRVLTVFRPSCFWPWLGYALAVCSSKDAAVATGSMKREGAKNSSSLRLLWTHPACGAAQHCLELKPCTCPRARLGWCCVGAGWSSLGSESCHHSWQHPRVRCCCSQLFLSVQERKKKSISAKSRLGLCLKPLSKEPCLNVIAPLLLQWENTLYCSFLESSASIFPAICV